MNGWIHSSCSSTHSLSALGFRFLVLLHHLLTSSFHWSQGIKWWNAFGAIFVVTQLHRLFNVFFFFSQARLSPVSPPYAHLIFFFMFPFCRSIVVHKTITVWCWVCVTELCRVCFFFIFFSIVLQLKMFHFPCMHLCRCCFWCVTIESIGCWLCVCLCGLITISGSWVIDWICYRNEFQLNRLAQ